MYKELGATDFCVATQDIPVETRTRMLDQNSVVTLSKFVATESKEKAQRTGRDKKLYATTKVSDKD